MTVLGRSPTLAGMAKKAKRKTARKKKGQHGGRREGAGRKPLDPAGELMIKAAISLSRRDIEKVMRWRGRHKDSETFAGALRQMIGLADEVDRPKVDRTTQPGLGDRRIEMPEEPDH